MDAGAILGVGLLVAALGVLLATKRASASSAPGLVAQPGPDGTALDTMARTIYGEARGESTAAQQGVGWVIRNRVNLGPLYGYPATVAGVCKQGNGSQFDCWMANAPTANMRSNYAATVSVTADDPAFVACRQVAQDVLDGVLPDNTGGAEFYHDTSIGEPQSWINAGYIRTAQIGRLIFYKRG